MRTVVISCDRCGKEITGYPVRIIPEYVERESGDLCPELDEGFPELPEKIRDRDFCEKCTDKIVRYALGGMKENEEFAKAVEEMVQGDPTNREEKG